MRASRWCVCVALLACGSSGGDPGSEPERPSVSEPTAPSAPDEPLEGEPRPPEDDAIEEVEAEVEVEVAARLDTFSFVDPCFSGRGATPEEAVAACRDRGRRGDVYERRVCRRCAREHVVTIAPDDPIAFYRGCCWAVGDTPEAAVVECQRRLADDWCELESGESTSTVTVVSGPHPRHRAVSEFDDIATHVYFVPEGEWTDRSGEPPCFPDGTRVLTAEGLLPIERLVAGTVLRTLDDAGDWRTSVVRGRKTREAPVLILEHAAGMLRVTAEHPVRARAHPRDPWSWVEAHRLRPGDELRTQDGVSRVRALRSNSERSVRVHTLRTSAPHTFLAEGVLVHNY